MVGREGRGERSGVETGRKGRGKTDETDGKYDGER